MKFGGIICFFAAALLTGRAAGPLPQPVCAAEQEELSENGYSYKLSEDGESVTILKYAGSEAELTVPGTLGGLPVTCIGDFAFQACADITSVTLPEGIQEIRGSAFASCSNLVRITIPEGTQSIADGVFYRCVSLEEVSLPQSLTSIGIMAFHACSSLTEIALPDGLTALGWGAFTDCRGLRAIRIPDGVTEIAESTFFGCSALTEAVIPETVTSIDSTAFMNCSSLTICGARGSFAESFAAEQGIPFRVPGERVWGDLDENGTVTVGDAVLAARFAANDPDIGKDLTAEGRLNGDVTGDGDLNGDDLTKILRFLASHLTKEELKP